MNPVLEVSGLSRQFGGLDALVDVALATFPGEIFGIIGPNGAGKTTLFNVITGTIAPTRGTVRFHDKPITGHSIDGVARLGLVRTFQATTVFRSQTVVENLRRAAVFSRISRPAQWFRPGAAAAAGAVAKTKAEEMLAFLALEAVANHRAGDLPYGLQKLLGVGMALAASPRMLLMDEPAAGLNPNETAALGDLVLRLRQERQIDIVIVEHDMPMIMRICDRIMVLNYGRVVCIDTPDRVRADPRVVEAYLGSEYERA